MTLTDLFSGGGGATDSTNTEAGTSTLETMLPAWLKKATNTKLFAPQSPKEPEGSTIDYSKLPLITPNSGTATMSGRPLQPGEGQPQGMAPISQADRDAKAAKDRADEAERAAWNASLSPAVGMALGVAKTGYDVANAATFGSLERMMSGAGDVGEAITQTLAKTDYSVSGALTGNPASPTARKYESMGASAVGGLVGFAEGSEAITPILTAGGMGPKLAMSATFGGLSAVGGVNQANQVADEADHAVEAGTMSQTEADNLKLKAKQAAIVSSGVSAVVGGVLPGAAQLGENLLGGVGEAGGFINKMFRAGGRAAGVAPVALAQEPVEAAIEGRQTNIGAQAQNLLMFSGGEAVGAFGHSEGPLEFSALKTAPKVNVDGMHPEAKSVLTDLDSFMAEQGMNGAITSGKRNWRMPSQHNSGSAVDLVLDGGREEMEAKLQSLRDAGYDAHFEVSGQKNANGSVATGDHIHINLRKGGRYDALAAGEAKPWSPEAITSDAVASAEAATAPPEVTEAPAPPQPEIRTSYHKEALDEMGEHTAFTPGTLQVSPDEPIVDHPVTTGANAGKRVYRGVVIDNADLAEAVTGVKAVPHDEGFFVPLDYTSRAGEAISTDIPEDVPNTIAEGANRSGVPEDANGVREFGPQDDRQGTPEGLGTRPEDLAGNRGEENPGSGGSQTDEIGKGRIEDATNTGIESQNSIEEHSGISRGSDVLTDGGEVRQGESGQAGSSRGDVGSPQIQEAPKSIQAKGLKLTELNEPPPRESGEALHNSAVLGSAFGSLQKPVEVFGKETVAPIGKNAVKFLRDMGKWAQGTFAPQTASDAAMKVALRAENATGEIARIKEQFRAANEGTMAKYLDKLPVDKQIEFQLQHDEGVHATDETPPEETGFHERLSNFYENLRQLANESGIPLGKNILSGQKHVGTYLPYNFEGTNDAEGSVLANMLRKNPLQGSASMLKERTHTMREHLENGEKPVIPNAYDQAMAYADALGKVIGANKIIAGALEDGSLTAYTNEEIRNGEVPKNLKRFNDSSGELWGPKSPLADIEGEVSKPEGKTPEHPEIGVTHHVYGTPEALKVLENFTQSGFGGPWGQMVRGVRKVNALANLTSLGFSTAHGAMTTIGSGAIEAADAVSTLSYKWGEKWDTRDALQAVFQTASSLNPVALPREGKKLMEEYRVRGTHPELTKIVDQITEHGFQPERSSQFADGMLRAMRQSFANGNPIKGLGYAPLVAFEQTAKPILQKLVPDVKIALAAHAISGVDARLPEGATKFMRDKAIRETLQNIDNVVGEVITANTHMGQKTVQSLHSILLRPWWTIGTGKAIYKGSVDFIGVTGKDLAAGKGFHISPQTAVLPIYVMRAALGNVLLAGVNALLQNDKSLLPSSADDYILGARTGYFDKDGSPIRMSMLSYMKDLPQFARNIGGTIASKLTPIPSLYDSWKRNSNYWGDQMYTPNANPISQVFEFAAHATFSTLTPYSLQGFLNSSNRAVRGVPKWMNAAGVMTVPKLVTESETGRILDKYFQDRSKGEEGKRPETKKKIENESATLAAYRVSKVAGDSVASKLIKEGGLTVEKANTLEERSSLTPFQAQLHAVEPKDFDIAVAAYRAATPAQKAILHDVMLQKAARNSDQEAGDAALAEFGMARPPLSTREQKALDTKARINSDPAYVEHPSQLLEEKSEKRSMDSVTRIAREF